MVCILGGKFYVNVVGWGDGVNFGIDEGMEIGGILVVVI